MAQGDSIASWKSADNSVATVSDGTNMGVAAGSTTITVTLLSGLSADINVTVAQPGFARCKLNLELGEYTRDDLDYLYQIYDTVKENEEYRAAIMAFIAALTDEYGWI